MPVSQRLWRNGIRSQPGRLNFGTARPMRGNCISNSVTACEERIRPIKTPVLGCGAVSNILRFVTIAADCTEVHYRGMVAHYRLRGA